MDIIFSLFVILIIILYIALFYNYFYNKSSFTSNTVVKNNKPSNKCGITCDSIDPVSDPKYNMQQIVKQSILLEEHLANKNKRCRDCITKHFLHIIGLAEEAQMLATNKIAKYPLINECVELYNRLFNKWLKENEIADSCSLNCCDELRNMRKKLIVAYFFNEDYNI